MSIFKRLLGYTRKDFKKSRLKAVRKVEDLSERLRPELENGSGTIELRVEAKSLDVKEA